MSNVIPSSFQVTRQTQQIQREDADEGRCGLHAATMNVGSSLPHGAVISGGEFNSSEGDHNHITFNILRGMKRHRDESADLSSVLHQGQRNLRKDRTLKTSKFQPNISQLHDSTPQPSEEQSGNAIYERQMLPKKHGFPLWVPQPSNFASLTHRREGVIIGDVGRITPYGAFDVLFNICKPAGPPGNPDELPDGFEPLVLKANDIYQVQEYTSGSYIASASVDKLGGLTFRYSSSEGAVLTMPDGAFHVDLRNISLFRDFAAENAKSWYQFINGPCGRELGNGELHLVTGCDKTTSWGLAACPNIEIRGDCSDKFGEPLLRFRDTSDADSCVPRASYRWEHDSMVEVKAGPGFEVDEEMPKSRARARNQCTFFRSHTIALSGPEWAEVQSTLVSALVPRRALKPSQPDPTSFSNFLTDVFSSLSIFGSRRNTGSATTTDYHICSPVIHPSTFIANMLLQRHPDAKVAIVHDDQWGTVIRENESRMPTGPELWKRIQETFNIILNRKGTIYLSEGSTPPQHASQQLAHEPLAPLLPLPDHHQMAANGIDIQNIKRLDGLIQVTATHPIACGGYADIYPGLWAISGRNLAVAIKVFRGAHVKARTPEAQRKYSMRLNKEYRVWALLQHPNVLPLFGLINDPAIPSTGIVAPFCSLGDLRTFFVNTASASVDRLAIVKGIASGLTYVHQKNVVHGDLTMNNILVEVINGVFTPLLSDFGRSRVLEQAGYTSSVGGALHRHMPPEILMVEAFDRTTKTFTQAGDVWCFGMVMLETLTGNIPFWYLNEIQAAMVVTYTNERPDQNRYPAFPHDDSCWQIMGKCWHQEPLDREKMACLLQSLNGLR